MDVNILPEKQPDIPAAKAADASSSLSPSSLEHSKPDPYASDGSIDLTDKVSERKLLLKVDLAVLPILFLLFLVSFVDRSNLGNARIEGLEKSLGIPPKSNGYNIALFSFTIPYVLFEVPANMLLKKIKPQMWLSGLMFCWGICTMGQGFTQNLGGLATCRALMGLFESGFVPGTEAAFERKLGQTRADGSPGCAYLIASYYKRHEFQFRYSIFFSAAILAGAFSGFLAYLLAKMDGAGGYEGWRWIFIIEGLMTVVISAIAFFLIAPWPEECKFLKPDEKALLLKRLSKDRGRGTMNRLDKRAFIKTLTDWKIWAG
ncbi:MAG: hypothetical protein Q9222_000528 [Ikaeria aurantiellina]